MHYMVLKVLRSTFKRAQGTRGKPAHGGIAQLVEHLLCKQGVIGSIPLTSTITEHPGGMPGCCVMVKETMVAVL